MEKGPTLAWSLENLITVTTMVAVSSMAIALAVQVAKRMTRANQLTSDDEAMPA